MNELKEKMVAFGVIERMENNGFLLDSSIHQSEHLWSSRVCPNTLLQKKNFCIVK
jgi:hypothetical protein